MDAVGKLQEYRVVTAAAQRIPVSRAAELKQPLSTPEICNCRLLERSDSH
jgi:hypothetical protein